MPPPTNGPPSGGPASLAHTPADRAPAKWTYMVYMSADNQLEDDAILNLNQMEMVGSSTGLNIVIQLDRSPDYDTTNGNWNDTRRYLVTHDTDPDIVNSQLLQDMGEVDMGRMESLRDFVIWAVSNYSADRYYLDVWGHGGGWRDGCCNDFTSGTYLDMGELKAALLEARAATGVTLDGVGFDQCLMAQLEVYYEVKAAGDDLTGAEELIPANGYNYTRVIGALDADLGLDGTQLGQAIVRAFFDEYGHDNERAMSAVDAEAFDADLVPAVTQLGQSLLAVAGSLHTEIKLARDYARAYYIFDYLDLGNFTERLLHYLPANATEQRAAAIRVREALNESVVANDYGTGREGSNGLSIYFPQWSPPWSYDGLSLSKEQGWDGFLKAYFLAEDEPLQAPSVTVDAPYNNSVVGLVVNVAGGAGDPDGNITAVQWKFDREDWRGIPVSGARFSANVSAAGLRAGDHRLSFRAVDDDGLYSPEVHLDVYVEDRGLMAGIAPQSARTFQGGNVTAVLNVSTFGNAGGEVEVRVVSSPFHTDLPLTQYLIPPGGHVDIPFTIGTNASSTKGAYEVLVRAYMVDAPQIQAFATIRVNVTERWPDLVAGPVLLAPADPKEGDRVTVNGSVSNTGLAAAGAFDLEVRYAMESDRGGCYTVLETVRVPGLAVGGVASISVDWQSSLGRHLFTVVADPASELRDLVPSDNSASRELVLEGFGVALDVLPAHRDTTAGAIEAFNVSFRNTGNLQDIVELRAGAPAGWTVVFNETAVLLGPKAAGAATMRVIVPLGAPGGTTAAIVVTATSFKDLTKAATVRVTLTVPEVFVMHLGSEPASGEVQPNGTVSFNLTVFNDGNGFENYTLEYARQTKDLFISAVNDTLEVPPGLSRTVEVFVSSLGTPVGGSDFQLKFTVRSKDDPMTYDAVVYRVRVARAFSVRTSETGGPHELRPGEVLATNLSILYEGNYCTTLVVALVGPPALFGEGSPVGVLLTQSVQPRSSFSRPLELQLVDEILAGHYAAELMVYELGSLSNVSRLEVPVDVLPVQHLVLRQLDVQPGKLHEGGEWLVNLSLSNLGNHPERVRLSLSGLPSWLTAGLSVGEVLLPAYGFARFNVSVRLDIGTPGASDGLYRLKVVATPDNITGAPQPVEVGVPVDVPEPPAHATHWWIYPVIAVVAALAATLVALLWWIDRRR